MDSSADDSAERRPAPAIVCVACRHLIADETDALEVSGAHEHRFTNPHGIEFVIRVFRNADCFAVGGATEEFTWFAGRSWRITLCRGCRAHLGWRFESGTGPPFFGLIVDRLLYV